MQSSPTCTSRGSEAQCSWQALSKALLGSATCLLSLQLRVETDSALRWAPVGSPAGRLHVGHAMTSDQACKSSQLAGSSLTDQSTSL